MTPPYELVMYSRSSPCPFVSIARKVLQREGVPYRELMIDKDRTYESRVREWTGFLSVPTLILALPGQDTPYVPPAPLAPGASPRGIDRGSMLTEAYEDELLAWLRKHGFLPAK
jgi:glutaredoxin